MNQKFKMLALAFVATVALTAFVPAAAQSQFTLTTSFTLSGSQSEQHKFLPAGGMGTITCLGGSFHGSAASLEEHSLVMSPTYSGCKDSLGRTVDIIKNTASFEFTSGATEGESKGSVDVTGEVVWTATTGGTHCTITMGSQTLSGVSYKDLGGTGGIEVTWNTTNVHTTISGGFFQCGSGETTPTKGTYTGKTAVTAKDSSGDAWGLGAD